MFSEQRFLLGRVVAKNNQKKEKALRNRENARKYRKKQPLGKGRFGGGRPGGGHSSAAVAVASSSPD